MTDTCPPGETLERLLVGRAHDPLNQALEAHVAGCADCQRRLAELNVGGLTLPAFLATRGKGEQVTRPALPISGAARETAGGAGNLATPPTTGVTSTPAAAPPTMTPATPTAFGRYQVRRALGSGGFGTVYLGHDTELDRPVAIKVRHGGAVSAAETEQFLQEARRLAKLRHPGIVAVHDVGTHEGGVYIVSDYVDGPDLGRWLEEHRPAWPEAVRLTAAVADALAHAHERLVVHRDVKPSNILLTADHSPVLVDFGMALDEAHAGGPEKGVISGTPWYMSPEQAAGTAHRIDGRTDVYSLGVVFYELLTGRVPFGAAGLLELLRQVRDDEPQPPRQLVRDIPPDLERACLKAMAKRQQDRYTTAADFADDLRRVLPAGRETLPARQTPAASPLPAAAVSGTDFSMTASSPRRAREAERRQVTVLVCACDLFESDAYLELDAEDQARVLRAFQDECAGVVGRFDGTVVQCNEQGLLVCFGYPVAYEDGARRGARTGLCLLEDLKALGDRLRRAHRLELNPRVSLHTGPAVVEAREGAVSLVGEARNVALRLREVAAAGQVICSDVTHRLIEREFRCAGIDQRRIKGVAQPVELFQVHAIAETGSPIEAAGPYALTPLIGRDHEVSLLKDRWEQAQEGLGQLVLLTGEAGMGKSRLVYTLKQHVLEQAVEGEVDAPVIEWRCAPHFQNTSLYPAIDSYERDLGFGREEPPTVRFDRLLRRLEAYGLARPETVPLWAALLSLPTPDHYPALGLSPARQREETFRALFEWLRTRAARKPVLFVVEDLHWADASTLEFLTQLLADGLHEPILIVLTFRPEFQAPWPAPAQQTGLALTSLTRRQVADLMRKKAGAELPDAVVKQVYDRAGGVPLFVEEFTRQVQESAGPGEAGEGSKVLPTREIPTTLQDLVTARLDRMGGERDVAQLAAVLGREFSYELLAAVTPLDEASLQAELAKLARADILHPKGRPPRCTYLFKHALLEDALYNAMVKGTRQHFHRRIGEALEGGFPQTAERQPELLGHHFTEAGIIEKAVDYWLRAGQRSRERSAFSEAIGHLTRGFALLGTLDESRSRDETELQLLTRLAPAYIAARGYAAPEAGPVLLRARELCRRMGDTRQQFGTMLGMWEWHIVRGDLRVCADQAADGMALAEKVADPGMMMEALFMPGVTMFYRGQFAGARTHYETALAGYDDRDRTKFWTAYTGHDAGVTHRCYLALTLWHLGYPDQALKLARETCELARTIGHPFSVEHALDFAAVLYHYCRLGDQVHARGEEEVAVATEQGFPFWNALGTLHKGAGMLLQGRLKESLPLLLKGFSAFRGSGAEVRVPTYLGMLADAYTQLGCYEDARAALKEGLAVAEKNDDRCHEAELQRLQGELMMAESAGQSSDAETWFRRAMETARCQQSRGWELRATMSLARLWQRQGRRDDARAALEAIYGTYTEGLTTPDLVDAKALLSG